MQFKKRLACLVIFFIIIIFYISIRKSNIDKHQSISNFNKFSPHKMAILVPFRDRFEELLMFLPYMQKYLSVKGILHKFYILNQIDEYRFNRAALINVGVLESYQDGSNTDYLSLHDVDLLPWNSNISYNYPSDGPVHLCPADLHPLYHYPLYFGGIVIISRDDYLSVNGMSNRFWGWGREDDEFRIRVIEKGLKIHRPHGITTGNRTFIHNHSVLRRSRDMKLYYNQRNLTFRRDYVTGLHSVKYSIQHRSEIMVDNVSATVLNIKLFCDEFVTPYCKLPRLTS